MSTKLLIKEKQYVLSGNLEQTSKLINGFIQWDISDLVYLFGVTLNVSIILDSYSIMFIKYQSVLENKIAY